MLRRLRKLLASILVPPVPTHVTTLTDGTGIKYLWIYRQKYKATGQEVWGSVYAVSEKEFLAILAQWNSQQSQFRYEL